MKSSQNQSKQPTKPGRHVSDMEWLKTNSPVITKKYARQWIAVYNHSVIASGMNPEIVRQNAMMILGHSHFTMRHIEKGILIL